MRPVLLDMHGFASFREPASVDFTDADYFALVGPTGSGKSTVIDAMTFALFGSVPRWSDKRMVALALAPTANRGTVRLVFDVGGQRYVVARELRRSKTGVNVKSARLERLDDPATLGALEDSTEVLAAESGVTAEVERLLGLSFENFCQCVVLPQGEFAEFLRAKPADRQNMLLKLLGAQRYDAIGKLANLRATAAGERAALLANQLLSYVDATEEAENAAAGHEKELEQLAARVTAVLPELAGFAKALAGATSARDQLSTEQAALAGLSIPGGIAELDSALMTSQQLVQGAAAAETAAQSADTVARERLAVGPVKAPLEQVRREHAELAQITTELPGVRSALEASTVASRSSVSACTAAEAALEIARGGRDEATASTAVAEAESGRLAAELSKLESVHLPEGLPQLDEQSSVARIVLAEASEVLAAAEHAETAAREALDTAPPRAPLDKALSDREALTQIEQALPALMSSQELSAQQHEDAVARSVAAGDQVENARAAREAVLASHRATALREHLILGEPCPVCEQGVTAIPPTLQVPELATADAAVKESELGFDAARRDETTAARAESKAAAAHDEAVQQANRLRAALAGQPSEAATIQRALAELDSLGSAVRTTVTALRDARTAQTKAQQRESEAVAAEAASRTALRVARDPLVALGAPPVESSELLHAWTELADWAQKELSTRTPALQHAQAAAKEVAAQREAARVLFEAAEADAKQRRADETRERGGLSVATASLERVERRVAELTAILVDAVSDAEAEAQLMHLASLESAVRDADAALRGARTDREAAELSARRLESDVATAWQNLRIARDRLVTFGAPDVEGAGVLTAWTTLHTWAASEAQARAALLPAAVKAMTLAQSRCDDADAQLATDLTAYDVVVPAGPIATTAPVAVAGAHERARSTRSRIAERRAEATRLVSNREAAETEQQVAKLLADLLRSTQFPRWLVASALDTLVLDASASLSELSGGQFELTHKNGEFFVVDHADADSHRSVRTLSGGETFQASLALALALSAQMSSLAAAGAARLDSIFLDEGFGTLDEATLEVVALTLENLANGDRMVGVITHVAALAERVPVRFAVRRDNRTSSVVRESA